MAVVGSRPASDFCCDSGQYYKGYLAMKDYYNYYKLLSVATLTFTVDLCVFMIHISWDSIVSCIFGSSVNSLDGMECTALYTMGVW